MVCLTIFIYNLSATRASFVVVDNVFYAKTLTVSVLRWQVGLLSMSPCES
jgi:hypothetical protein